MLYGWGKDDLVYFIYENAKRIKQTGNEFVVQLPNTKTTIIREDKHKKDEQLAAKAQEFK